MEFSTLRSSISFAQLEFVVSSQTPKPASPDYCFIGVQASFQFVREFHKGLSCSSIACLPHKALLTDQCSAASLIWLENQMPHSSLIALTIQSSDFQIVS